MVQHGNILTQGHCIGISIATTDISRFETACWVQSGVSVLVTCWSTSMAPSRAAGGGAAFELADYPHMHCGYAATVHKTQELTVDRAHVLVMPSFDLHTAYMALTRH